MMRTIFFRGRNTAAIIEDARRYLGDLGEITVVCRDGDQLYEVGDIAISDLSLIVSDGEDLAVVANGGTTAQLVPVVASLTRNAASADALAGSWDSQGRIPERSWKYHILDLQRDGAVFMAGDEAEADDHNS